MVSPTERRWDRVRSRTEVTWHGRGLIARPLYSILKFKAINDCHHIQGDTFQAKLCVDTLFPARESLVSDITAGTGKSLTFLQCIAGVQYRHVCTNGGIFYTPFSKVFWVNSLVSLLFSSLTPPSPLHSTLYCLSVSLFPVLYLCMFVMRWYMIHDKCIPPLPKRTTIISLSLHHLLVYLFVIDCMVQITNILWRPTFHVVQFLILLWRDFIYVKIPE